MISSISNISYPIKFVWKNTKSTRNSTNELVDHAAKQASTFFPISNLPVYSWHVRIKLEHHLHEKFARNGQNTPTTNKLKAIKPLSMHWSSVCESNRREEVTLRCLRIGYTQSSYS